MLQAFLYSYLCITAVCYASHEGQTSAQPTPISIHLTNNSDDRIASAAEAEEPVFSTPENAAQTERAYSLDSLSVRAGHSHEPISPQINAESRDAHPSFALSVAATSEAPAHSRALAASSLNLSKRFKDGVQNAEWEKALEMIPNKVKVVPSPCVQKFKRIYTSFADGLSLCSLVMYGISGVAAGLGGVDYLSNNAFLEPDIMVTIVGLGLIGSVLFKYLWISLSYVKKMDQKRLVSYERRAQELETEKYTNDQLTERFERANIFLMYPSRSMVTARQFLFNFLCCSETLSSTLLAIAGGVFATSAASGITDKDLLHLGSQELYLKISQGSGLSYAIIYLLHEKAKILKDRCEAWLTVQQLAKLYLEQVLGVEKDDVYTAIYDLQGHLIHENGNLVVA
jgi:hypothetical protein